MRDYSEAVLRDFNDIHSGRKATLSNIGKGNESRHIREDNREKEQEEKCWKEWRGCVHGRSFKTDRCSAWSPSKRRVIVVGGEGRLIVTTDKYGW